MYIAYFFHEHLCERCYNIVTHTFTNTFTLARSRLEEESHGAKGAIIVAVFVRDFRKGVRRGVRKGVLNI